MARTQEVADEICERIADGESLRSICRDDRMPSKAEVFRWLADSSEFRDQYARARETQADTYFDEIIAIADDQDQDPNSRRIRVDARKWAAGKLRPKVYGEKLDLNHSGSVKFEKIECVVIDPAA